MQRRLWILLGWSPDYGAPTTVVAVLGLDIDDDTGAVTPHIEWVPREYTAGQIWRERIATTPVEDLPTHLQRWENSPAAPAAEVEPSTRARDLADAVQTQLDDILRPSR